MRIQKNLFYHKNAVQNKRKTMNLILGRVSTFDWQMMSIDKRRFVAKEEYNWFNNLTNFTESS